MLNETTLKELNNFCKKHNKEAVIRHGQLRGLKGYSIFKILGVREI